MKKRTGLVSNSSSSSFVLFMEDITKEQAETIINHAREGYKWGCDDAEHYPWEIDAREHVITGQTSMNNFNMRKFMELIGVNIDKVKWGHS